MTEPMFRMRPFVFSRRMNPADFPDVTVVQDDVEGVVRSLKAEDGKDIWLFGGGLLFQSLLELDLVDGVEVAVIPVLLGGGIPLFPPPSPTRRLRLTSHRVYEKTGTVSLAYEVVPETDA